MRAGRGEADVRIGAVEAAARIIGPVPRERLVRRDAV